MEVPYVEVNIKAGSRGRGQGWKYQRHGGCGLDQGMAWGSD